MANKELLTTLQSLISGLNESLVIFTAEGEILYTSFSLNQLFRQENLVGASIFDFIDNDSEGVRVFLSTINHSQFTDLQINMLRNGRKFPVRLRMAAWLNAKNEYVVLASLIDATSIERKKRDLLRKTLTIEQLSKSRKIRNGKLHDAIYEILEMSSKAVGTHRVNAWLFNKDHTQIECIGNFDSAVNGMVPQESLPVFDMPTYFGLFETEKIILAHNAQSSELTSELNDSYLIPNDIQSLMDIPLRIEGEIIGVICFEEVGAKRVWGLQEQKFGLIASQMVSLSVETFNRKIAQQQLEQALRQEKRLMSETNHRIKNNLAITASLMRMQRAKCKDDYHRELMQDSVNRILSISALHELLGSSETAHRVRFEKYAEQVIQGVTNSLDSTSKQIQLIATIADCEMASSLAVTLGLIINEVVTNAYKHAFSDQASGVIRIDFTVLNVMAKLQISDSGKGLLNQEWKQGEGFEIIRGMADHVDAQLVINGDAGLEVSLEFELR